MVGPREFLARELDAEAELVQEFAHVPGMVRDVPSALNVVGNHGAGPDASAVTGAAGSALDGFAQEHSFVRVEFARPPGLGFGVEAREAVRPEFAQPFLHGLVGSSDAAGDARQFHSLVGQEDRSASVGKAGLSGACEGFLLLRHRVALGLRQRDWCCCASHQ
jgi:hypothetical protein